MSKKQQLLTMVCILFGTNALFAVVIGDWEQQMDGWERVDAYDPNIHTVEYDDTFGVTLGNHSLYLRTEPTGQDVLQFSLIDNDRVEDFRNNLEIALDVTRIVDEWEEDTSPYTQFRVRIQAGQGNPEDANDPNAWSIDQQLSEPAAWRPISPIGSDPMHAVYDYSLILGMIDFENLDYLRIVLATSWNGFTTGGNYNVDNVRLQGGGPAYDPSPAHDVRGVSPEDDVILSWTSGVFGALQDVYFGTSPVDVAEATREDDRGVLLSKEQAESEFNPGLLEYNRSYHWRVDMVNETGEILKGQVWTFTTPYLGSGLVMGDFEQAMDGWFLNPNATGEFDFSNTGATLGDYSLVLTTSGGFWKLRWNGPPVDLNIYDRFQMDVSIIAEEFGPAWTNVQQLAINGPFGWTPFKNPVAIDLKTGEIAVAPNGDPIPGGVWQYWHGDMDRRITFDLSTYDWSAVDILNVNYFELNLAIQNNGKHPAPFYIDNMRFINSREAHTPSPADTAKEISRDTLLSWLAGRTGTQRDVYWGTDMDAVADVNQANIGDYPDVNYERTTDLSVDPGKLDFVQKYYWRVDEIEADGTIWQGPVWSFTTGDFIVLDDFQDYNDISDDTAIWSVWLDGWLPNDEINPDNGALIGTEVLPDGNQAMNLDYDNSLAPVSEVSRQWDGDQSDWAAEDMKSLSFLVRGFPESQGSITETATNAYTMVGAGSDIWNFEDGCFFAYKTLTGAGSITARVGAILPQSGANTDVKTWAKAGLMMRKSLDASSANQFAGVSGGTGITNQYRLNDFDETKDGGGNNDLTERPIWLRLDRSDAGYITASYATDNNGQPGPWEVFEETFFGIAGEVLVGLAISSNDPYVPVQADISNVSITGNVVGDTFAAQEIGIHQNMSDPLYVTIKDSKGNTATVSGDSTGLTNLDWTQQIFMLSDFTGVDLTDVDSLMIGIGNSGSAASQAKGNVSINDIRLHMNP